MFPPNLQKNIQELERQISLLETECRHMEAEKQESTPTSGKTNSKPMSRESPNQPFITGPCVNVSSYSSKVLSLPPTVPKIYSASCAYFKTSNEKHFRANVPKCVDSNHPEKNDTFQETRSEPTTKCSPSVNSHDDKSNAHVAEKKESTSDQKQNCDTENKKITKRSIDSIKEVSESSEENLAHAVSSKSKPKYNVTKEQTWCELLREQSPSSKWQEKNKMKKNSERKIEQNFSESKLSSDEECKKGLINEKTHSLSGNWMGEYENKTARGSRVSSKRRSRSARTKKNCANEIPVDINITKALLEKEIQCALWSEEKEKDEFFNGLNESVKILHFLIAELKTKLSREKRDGVLSDMQNTLMKISGIKTNAFENHLMPLPSLKETGLKFMENGGNILEVKNTIFAMKKFCEELSEEKSALSEEVSVKNRTLANFKTKEKEYLSLIASLKFNLEKMKEEADEGARAKRDLKILKIKLQEEAKVIEALKKSHEKMQELVENYVLENDKLRAQVKIVKLESQKFHVLLAGKEAEIKKYKKELESFQRQITEQLSLLRSKATENEVEQTIEAISNQRSILQTDLDSFKNQLDASFKNEFNMGDMSMESSTTITQPKDKEKNSNEVNVNEKNEWDGQSSISRDEQKPEMSTKNAVSTPMESETEINSTKRQYGLERVLSSSKNLRSSINELLEDIRRESTEMYWLSATNSCATSSQSAVVSTSSEDLSDGEQNI